METLSTKEKLLAIGKDEFLAHGFKDASLRTIGKKAGFTLGAFYGYYPSKEALFDAIVEAPAERLYDQFIRWQEAFARQPEDVQAREMDDASHGGINMMLDAIYADFDAFKLVFFRAAGTRYEHYLQRFVDGEIASTKRYIEMLKRQGHAVYVDDDIIHILASAMFSGMVEVVDHDMPKEKARQYMEQLRGFYSAGWHFLLGT